MESKKTAENQRDATITNLARLLGTKATVEDILRKIVELKDSLSRLETEKTEIEQYITPGRWALGVLGRHPGILRKHRDRILRLLDRPPSALEYTDEIGTTIIRLTHDEVIKYRGLVPKTELVIAKAAADNLKFLMDWVVKPFLRDPTQLRLEQRRCLIGAFIDSGLTKENFEEYRSKFAISWRKCPTHKETDLRLNMATLRFECIKPGCKYAE